MKGPMQRRETIAAQIVHSRWRANQRGLLGAGALEIADDFRSLACANGSPDIDINAVRHKTHAAIGDCDMHATHMSAVGRR